MKELFLRTYVQYQHFRDIDHNTVAECALPHDKQFQSSSSTSSPSSSTSPPLLLFFIAVGCIELCRFPHILLSLRLGSDNCITVFVQTQCTHCCFLLCLALPPTCRAGNCATIAAPAAIAPLKNLCSLVGDWKCTK